MKSYWSGCVSPREASITFRTFTVKYQIWSKLCGMGELTVQVLEASARRNWQARLCTAGPGWRTTTTGAMTIQCLSLQPGKLYTVFSSCGTIQKASATTSTMMLQPRCRDSALSDLHVEFETLRRKGRAQPDCRSAGPVAVGRSALLEPLKFSMQLQQLSHSQLPSLFDKKIPETP